jgi:hypothetical protein
MGVKLENTADGIMFNDLQQYGIWMRNGSFSRK